MPIVYTKGRKRKAAALDADAPVVREVDAAVGGDPPAPDKVEPAGVVPKGEPELPSTAADEAVPEVESVGGGQADGKVSAPAAESVPAVEASGEDGGGSYPVAKGPPPEAAVVIPAVEADGMDDGGSNPDAKVSPPVAGELPAVEAVEEGTGVSYPDEKGSPPVAVPAFEAVNEDAGGGCVDDNGSPPTAVIVPAVEAVNEVFRGDRADENGSPPMAVALPVVEAVGNESPPPQAVAVLVSSNENENDAKEMILDESEAKIVVPHDSEMEAVVEDENESKVVVVAALQERELAENDAAEMVDLSTVVVEGIPLGEGDVLLPGDEVHRRHFAAQVQEVDGMDGYYSPPKEAFVLTLADTHTPLIDDLVVIRDHDTSMVLADQEEPRDSSARGGLDRTALRCHEHTLKLEEWKLSRKQKELVCRAGFGHFIKIGSFTLDKQHITALVERWNKETNTFHLPVGEMTITLDEAAINLGLAIDGDPVVAVSAKDETVGSMCLKYLGKAPSPSDKKGGFLKLGWLKDSFSICPEDAPIEKVEQHTRAYLLYLVGSTIFSTTTGNTVPVLYLPLFEDFDKAGKYAWGAAALAFLYRSLSNASSRAQNTISGCLTLLQCWSYLHLDIRRPRLSEKANLDIFPLALRWKQKQSGHRTKWSVLQYQKALEALQPYDVEWLPYKNIVNIIPEDMRGSLILGKSKTTLLCLDKAEKHNPDRCLRQFGMPQPIPETVPLLKESDGESRQTEGKDLSHGEWLERRERIVEEDSGVDDEEYAEWYSKFSRNVRRKTSLEDVYQQTVIGLTKMLELAETLSRDDMPTKNKEVVRNITYTLSESLREVVSVMATSPQKGN